MLEDPRIIAIFCSLIAIILILMIHCVYLIIERDRTKCRMAVLERDVEFYKRRRDELSIAYGKVSYRNRQLISESLEHTVRLPPKEKRRPDLDEDDPSKGCTSIW